MRAIGLPDLIAALYEAAVGGAEWGAAGSALKHLVQANTAALWVGEPREGRIEVLCTPDIPDSATRAYVEHYHALDVWAAAGLRLHALEEPSSAPVAHLGHEFLSDADYQRSEFYTDFARGIGLRHLVGAVMPLGGRRGVAALGLHRPHDAKPFGEAQRRAVRAVLPHLRSALHLRHRLEAAAADRSAAPVASRALDALTTAVVVADADGRVALANTEAERLAAQGLGLRLERPAAGCRDAGGGTRVAAANRDEAAALARTVRAVALLRAPGGGMRLRSAPRTGDAEAGDVLVFVAPLPASLAPLGIAARGEGPGHGYALLLARSAARAPSPPAPALLADLYGLTCAEAEVAVLLAGGATAKAVAATRGVETTTVRWQARCVLEKAGARNLRHLEQILTSLPVA